MNIAAYCRVSTDKEDQLNSLEAQKQFFLDYTNRTGDRLVKLYADEGISGTKIKNRKQFLQMIEDAELGLFDMVVVKDISRFARNTVDLLQNIRKLKTLGIETQFLTANMTSMGNSEFVLTIFGALAQEESYNTSKRVKFGKKINAEKGRVPNIVYGYDKTIGKYFDLSINEREADVIREIFRLYTEDGFGAAKIANTLNAKNLKTKRGCSWSQNAICRILTNEIYTGKVINGKEEVADFLTGKRTEKNSDEWLITIKPELRIIDDDTFANAQKLLKERVNKFNINRERHSNKYLFSTLIKCKECGWSFRRCVRTYKNTYVRWVCSAHNGKGADNCPNAVTIDENELISAIENYFVHILSQKKNVIKHIVDEFNKIYKEKDKNDNYKNELLSSLLKLENKRQKYMDMYTDDLISREELNQKIGDDKQEIERLRKELALLGGQALSESKIKSILNSTFQDIEDIVDLRNATNAQLKRIIEKIEVDKNGQVEIFLKALSGLNSSKSICVTKSENTDSQNFVWLLK